MNFIKKAFFSNNQSQRKLAAAKKVELERTEKTIESESEDDKLTIEKLAEKRKKIKEELMKKEEAAKKQAFEKDVKELNIETLIIDYFTVNKKAIREKIADFLANKYNDSIVIFDYKKELWFEKLENICSSYNFSSQKYISNILVLHKARLLSIINSDKKAQLYLGYHRGKACNISYYRVNLESDQT